MFYQEIEDWQDRETACHYSIPNTHNLESAVFWVTSNIKSQRPEEIDYWQTSCETLKTWTGDCEDFVILLWRTLENNVSFDGSNRIAILYNTKSNYYHSVVITYYSNEIVEVADPSIISPKKIFESNEFFRKFPYQLLIEFNINSIWEY